MGTKIKKILFIGLDNYGMEIANQIVSIINTRDGSIGPFINLFNYFNEVDKLLANQNRKVEHSNKDCETVYHIISENEKYIEKIIIEKIEEIQKIQVSNGLDDLYDHDESINIILISSLFDKIGSSSLLPITRIIQNIFSGRLKGSHYEINYLLFFPDLFDECKNSEENYIRSYCCLQEFDFILDNPDYLMPESFLPINYIFLFTNSNERSEKLGTYIDLIPMLSEILYLLMTKKIAKDNSFSSILLSKIENKTTRYSSLGFTKLVFPKDKIMDWLIADFKIQSTDYKLKTDEGNFEKEAIVSEINSFYNESKIEKIEEEFKRDKNGKTIFQEFKYHGKINENIVIDYFRHDINEQYKSFLHKEMVELNKNLIERKKEILIEKEELVVFKVDSGLNNGNRSIYYNSAFLNLLIGNDSIRITGESINEIRNINSLENRIYGYFCDMMDFEKDLKRNLVDLKRKLAEKERYYNNLVEDKCEVLNAKTTIIDEQISLKEKYSVEITEIKNSIKELEEKNNETETIINDPSARRETLEKIKKNNEEEIDNLFDELSDIENNYVRAKEDLEDMYRKRRSFLIKYLLAIPIIFALATVLILGSAAFIFKMHIEGTMLNVIKYGALIIFITYGSWLIFKFKKDIFIRLTELKNTLEATKNAKKSKCLSIQSNMSNFTNNYYRFLTNELLLIFIKEYKVYIANIICNVDNYINALNLLKTENVKKKELIQFPNNVFVQSVISKDELNKIVIDRKIQSNYIEKYFIDNNFSKYYHTFLSNNNLNKFEEEIESEAKDVYKEIVKISIEELLLTEYNKKNINVNERLAKLFENSSAFIRLDVERGMDNSDSICFLGIYDQNKSEIQNIFNTNGIKLQAYGNLNQYEISIARLKMGFPAFHIGLVNYGKRLIKERGNKNLPHIYEFDFEELTPSNLNDLDEFSKLFYISKILQFIVEDENGCHFDTKTLGKNEEESILYLKSLRGNEVRIALKHRVENRMKQDGVIEIFENYKNNRTVNETEESVIRYVIQTLNPVS